MKQPSLQILSKLQGRAIPVRGDDVDTDRIMPARFLRCVTFAGIEAHVFEDDRKSAGATPHPFDQERFRGASVLVVGRNFGCGSSREHAPQGLQRWGIRAIVGESFAEIFAGNCLALGMPCVTIEAGQVRELQGLIEKDPTLELTVDIEARSVAARSQTSGTLEFAARIPDAVRESFLRGTWNVTALLVENTDRTCAVAEKLPYFRQFT